MSHFMKTCSMILVLVLLFNLLPHQTIAAEWNDHTQNLAADTISADDFEIVTAENSDTPAVIVAEVTENRTEFSKEYKLSNGLHMAVVYPEAVHYEEDGQWKDIDNTLVAVGSRATGAFTNAAGAWNVTLPQQMNKSSRVSVEKDGYTVSFGMDGEVRKTLRPVTGGLETTNIGDGTSIDAVLTVTEMQTSAASVEMLDYTLAKASVQHPEIVRDKLKSRLAYNNVYENTNIVYDMSAYQLKESIVIGCFNAAVQGYRYTLGTGGLVPVLNDDGSIDLVAPDSQEVVFRMPAPYMIDNAGEISRDVDVSLVRSGSVYTLTYTMPMQWLAEEDRVWPVVLDPAVMPNLRTSNIKDQFVSEHFNPPYDVGALYIGYHKTASEHFGRSRAYIKYENLPVISSADVIVNAEFSLLYKGGSDTTTTIEAHRVLGNWNSREINWTNQPAIDSNVIEDYTHVSYDPSYTESNILSEAARATRYSWVITDVAREWYKEHNYGIMLKASSSSEATTSGDWKKFFSVDFNADSTLLSPYLTITFRNSNGLESYWDYTASSAGRAGTGYVNNYSGNLTWVHNDIGFGGNRMPVNISHIYNTNDVASNSFGLGYGWRTNFNQTISIEKWHEDTAQEITYYVWTDGDGTKHYFLKESEGVYKDEDGLELTLTVSGNEKTITDKYGNASVFNSADLLVRLENNQQEKSCITVTYDATSNQISQIKDGVERKYNFIYTEGLLTRISYVGKGTEEIAYVSFAYEDSNLISITDQDGKSCFYTYDTNSFLVGAQDIDGYKLQYTYASGMPKRVVGISEWDGTVSGGSMTIEYAHNQTTFINHNNNKQIKQFNDWGNLTAVQDGQGRAQYASYATDWETGSQAKGNQLTFSSKLQNTVINKFVNSSFEESTPMWSANTTTVTRTHSTEASYIGNYSMKLVGSVDSSRYGYYSPQYSVEPGETVTFSAYIKTVDASVGLAIERSTNYHIFDGVVVPAGKDWNRYQMSYTNTSAETEYFRCYFFVQDAGTVYIDCVQLEQMPTASRYNLVQNSDFSNTTAWSGNAGEIVTEIVDAGAQGTAAPHVDGNFYEIVGDPTAQKRISQTIAVSGNAGDSFVFAGWAKADSAPLTETQRSFGLELVFHYTDGLSGGATVDFNTSCDSSVSWQYAAAAAVAEKAYSSVTIRVCYDYNVNTAYFDGIQLFREEFGSSYAYDQQNPQNSTEEYDSVVDLQNKETRYYYNQVSNNLSRVVLVDGGNEITQMTYTYDEHHNVETATTGSGVVYRFEYDDYGNNTAVEIVNGDQVIRSTATYTDDGNSLESVKDALDNETKYGYNEDTNVLEWVEYPNDSELTRTEYTYDEMYRLATAEADVSSGYTLTASYTYTDDLLTRLQTNTTTYSFTYGDFAQRTGVAVGNQTLATYAYTQDANRYLDTLTYGNGDSVQYTYDSYGRLVKETYEDGATISYAYDNEGNLARVTGLQPSAIPYGGTEWVITYYYDLTGRLVRQTEVGSACDHEITYTYDDRNNLVTMKETRNGRSHVNTYTYDQNNRLTQIGYGVASKVFGYDSYGRLTDRDVKYNSNLVFEENYTYKTNPDGTPTGQIAAWQNENTKYDVTYSYSYDANGNITAISDGTNTTTYVYDSANQLIRENNQAGNFTHVWAYDDAGNILSRKEYAYTTGALGAPTDTVTYTYGDSNWGDKLTAYDGKTITYDGVGNPLNDGTWTYTWRHGRELSTMTNGTITVRNSYNPDGARIAKIVNRSNGSETHRYTYNGGKLVYDIIRINKEGTISNLTILMSYDESGRPFMITYANVSYYYLLNAQGDVVGIMNVSGDIMVEYTYDAWGNVLSITGPMASTMGQHNQLRYRGYVYDPETNLYFLNSRFYNPETGRFINADALTSTGGLLGNNMFAYCANSPVLLCDPNGMASMISLGFGNTDPRLPCLDSGSSGGLAMTAVVTVALLMMPPPDQVQKKKAIPITTPRSSNVSEDYTVYFLYDVLDSTKTIIYVGRVKTANFEARMNYHSTQGRELKSYISGLSYAECRAFEQAGMAYYHTINRRNAIYNQIRGISPKNRNRYTYINAVFDLMNQNCYPQNDVLPVSYWENFVENEFLNLGS